MILQAICLRMRLVHSLRRLLCLLLSSSLLRLSLCTLLYFLLFRRLFVFCCSPLSLLLLTLCFQKSLDISILMMAYLNRLLLMFLDCFHNLHSDFLCMYPLLLRFLLLTFCLLPFFARCLDYWNWILTFLLILETLVLWIHWYLNFLSAL